MSGFYIYKPIYIYIYIEGKFISFCIPDGPSNIIYWILLHAHTKLYLWRPHGSRCLS